MLNLVNNAKTNNNTLLGVVKSNKTHEFLSPLRDENYIEKLTEGRKELLYTDLPENSEENQRFIKVGKSYLARLHEHALKWFRVDVGYSPKDIKQIFSDLAHYSCSQELLGYPLPLIDAHQGCITIHKIKDDYISLLIKIAKKVGISTEVLLNGITNFEGRAEGDFHSLLDSYTL